MKFVLFILAQFFVLTAFTQVVLKVETIDKQTKDQLSHVGVVFEVNAIQSRTFYTNREGIAYLQIPNNEVVALSFEHFAYEVIDAPDPKVYQGKTGDTLTVLVKMRFIKSTSIGEVVIKPAGVPDTVFQSLRVSVQDFDFLPNGQLLLLAYPKNMRKGTELLLYDGFEVKSEIPLKEKGLEIIRDYRGNPHVVSDKSVNGILMSDNRIQIAQLDKAYYMTYIAPIVDTTVTKYFFSNFSDVYPAFEYFTFDLVDSTYRKIAKIEDELMMELYRSEYKWVDVRTKLWARQKEMETGVDAEIWVGANYFTQSVYYKELYAPMFERNDSVFVFDHYKNWLFRYTKQGELMDSLPIYHHLQAKQTGWKKQIIQDQTTGQIYLVYEKAGKVNLRRFDVASGKLEESIPLYFKYPENILIRSNTVYYSYRPFESAQKKFLYQEKLPIKYPTSLVNNGDDYQLK
ncbi:MAG: hypothetical protein IT221_15760 [Fluviicola sp.]|nr:hypothetical protein [Fluviicola sp.]